MTVSTRKRVKEAELTITPMIDIVFLLITFFMVVSEITRQDDFEDLQLPDVKASELVENPELGQLIITVRSDGSYWISGSPCGEREVKDTLLLWVRLNRRTDGSSECSVLVKADRRVRFEAIRKLIALCVDRDTRIWRLAFGTLPSRPDEPAREEVASSPL